MADAETAYKLLLQVRDIDVQLMWNRVSVMLIIQGVLFSFLATAFSSLIGEYPLVILLTESFGAIFAYFLVKISKGGSYWVKHWEKKLEQIENESLCEFKIFQDSPAVNEKIKEEEKKKGYISTKDTIKTVSWIFLLIWEILILYTTYITFGAIISCILLSIFVILHLAYGLQKLAYKKEIEEEARKEVDESIKDKNSLMDMETRKNYT
ncbi:MAG: hypothetical protein CVU81_00440 [Euryarchaeota archaeon HGW-Euryarchaeota-1]|nr:MAG: hypothetical protein CVU81_00440 [Euryarchaeota archaeon HGW-Euryarchaeota-1]